VSYFAAIVRRLFAVSAVLLLAACGGGGGGGGGGATDPGQAGGMSVSPTSLAFTAQSNGVTPAVQSITLSITASDAAYVLAGVPSGSTLPSWLSIDWANSPGANVLNVFITTTGLSPGTRTATLRLGIARAEQTLIAYRDVQVTYTVTSRISATPAALSFTQFIGSAAAAAQTLNFSDNGGGSYPWTTSVAYQSGSGWLTLSAASGGSLPAAISVGVNPNAGAGTYNATIIATGNGDSVSIPVSYSVRAPGLVPSQASVSFSARNAQSSLPTPIGVPVSAENGATLSYVASVTYAAGSSGWLTATGSTAPGTLSIAPNTVNLSAGTYTATVTLTPSNGANATSIGVSYTVQASTISANPAQVSFSAFSGQASLPTAASVTTSASPGDTVSYTTSITYGAGASGWLSTTGNTAPGTLSIAPSTTNLAPGTYTATVRLTPSTGAAAINVGATYSVAASSLTLSSSSTTYNINPASTAIPSILNRSVSVGSTGVALNWTATSSDPWLTVSPASGTSGTSVTLSLVPAQIDALEAGTRSATITFSYTPPYGSPASAPFTATLNLQLPKVNFVAPYVASPNTSKEVIVRGSGFNSATGLDVMFGPNAVSTYTVVSDTEIHVTHPSLAASSYQVRIPNQFGINRTRANLVVAAPPTFTYAALPTSLVRSRTLFDAERVAIYTNNQSAAYGGPAGVPRIERHRLVSGSWVTDSLLLNGPPNDIALTPDGQEMIALSPSTLYHINLNSWTITNQTDISTFAYPYNYSGFGHIAMSNDGNALVHVGGQWITMFRYNVLTRIFTLVPGYAYNLYGGISPVASLDGSRILVGQNGTSGPLPLYYFDTSLSQFVQALPNLTVNRMSYDRTGTYALIDGYIYNRQFQPQGLEFNLMLGTISPEGTRAYGFVYGGTGGTLRTYDVTSPNNIGGFSEIGTGIVVPDSPGNYPTFGISLDGHAVLISGEAKFIIQPVP
jgi:hypothetical protein